MENKGICYELTLTQNYVSDWTFNDAIRELIQNGTDQEILDKENEFSLEYDYDRKVLQLWNSKSVLKINTLLLGRSTKADNKDTVGQFGEGYKIAALVLNRLGKTFTIFNNEKNEVWESRFKNSERWLEKILAFYVRKEDTEDSGLLIEVGNVSEDEYDGLSNVWLEMCGFDYGKILTSYGEILTDEELKGYTYVNGLAFECGEELDFGYNFKPEYVELERDRKTCDSWNIKSITCKMVAEGMVNGDIDFEVVNKMVSSNSSDVSLLEYNTHVGEAKEVQKKLIETFDKKNTKPYSIPVNSQEDIQKVKEYGGNPVVVPYKVAQLLKSETDRRFEELKKIPVAHGMTLKERFLRWYRAYKGDIRHGSAELKSLIDELE